MPKQSKKTPSTEAVGKKAKKPTTKTSKKGSTSTDTTAESAKKRGSPSLYDSKVKPYLTDIARYVRCGVTEGQLCAYYDVGKTQWAEYKKKYPELTETLYKAKTALSVDLSNQAYKVAMGYDYEESTTVTYRDKDGNVTGTKTTTHQRHAKADGGMIQFMLINRFSDEFARDPQAIELRKKALELAAEGKLPPNGAEGI